MTIKDLFGRDRNQSEMSIDCVRELFDLSVVANTYIYQTLDMEKDENLSGIKEGFVELLELEDSNVVLDNFKFYFFTTSNSLCLCISNKVVDENENEVTEALHYFADLSDMNSRKVFVGYQENQEKGETPVFVSEEDYIYYKKAFPYFILLCDFMKFLNQMNEFENNLSTMIKKAQLIDVGRMNHQPPISSLFYNNIWFDVVSLREGLNILKGIRGVNNTGEDLYRENGSFLNLEKENTYFLVAKEDIKVENFEALDEIEGYDISVQGYLFLGNLTVDKTFFCNDLDYSPIVVVKKDFKVLNAYFCGNIHYIGGNLTGDFIYCKYIKGQLHVQQTFDVRVVVSCNMNCYFNNIKVSVIISDNMIYGVDRLKDENGNPCFALNLYPTTHSVRDVFDDNIRIDTLWGVEFPNDDDIILALTNNTRITKYRNHYVGFNTTISSRFNAIFNKITDDSEKCSYRIDDNFYCEYFYNIFDFQGKKYREIGKLDKLGHYQARILHDIIEDSYDAYVEFYKDDNVTFISAFKSKLTDTFTSTKSAQFSFNQAEEIFNKDKGSN